MVNKNGIIDNAIFKGAIGTHISNHTKLTNHYCLLYGNTVYSLDTDSETLIQFCKAMTATDVALY